MPWLLYPWEGAPVLIVVEAGWAPGPVWTDMEKKKIFPPAGLEPQPIYPVASRITNYAILVPNSNNNSSKNQVWQTSFL
jgi:hypothetical protein